MITMRKNLLQINGGDIGGGAYEISEYIHYAMKLSWNTSMLVGHKKSTDPTISKIRCSQISTYANLFLGLEYMFYLNTFFLVRKQEFKQADIVHYHNLHGSYFNLLALPLLTRKKPSVWTFHDMWPMLGHAAHSLDCERCENGKMCRKHKQLTPKLYTWDSSALLYHIKRWILARSNFHIVVPSMWLKNKITHSFLSNKPIHLIHNGINTNLFVPKDKEKIRAELGLPQQKRIIVFLASGGLSNPWKGGQFAEHLIKHFSAQRDTIFLSIGGINPTFNDLPNLQQIGYISDKTKLVKYYSAGDIFFSPSIAENLSLTILEAMACGLPTLAFNVGGTPEIVDHLVNGYIAKNKDLNDLITGMNYLLDTKNLKNMATTARIKIVKHFTLDNMITRYETLYQSILHPEL